MNEEMINYEVNEEVEAIEVSNEEPETSNNGIVGKVIVGAVVGVVAGAAALIYKNRHKIEEKRKQKRIHKLEQEGYVIYKPEVSANTEIVDVDDCEDAE